MPETSVSTMVGSVQLKIFQFEIKSFEADQFELFQRFLSSPEEREKNWIKKRLKII